MKDKITKVITVTRAKGYIYSEQGMVPVEVEYAGKLSKEQIVRKARRENNTFNISELTQDKALYSMPVLEFVEHAERVENKE